MINVADPSGPKRPKDGRIARGAITREKVLDAAERCFSQSGFDAVSVRQIAREADVTLGVVGFHGGSKESLFRTVLQRRVETLNTLRLEGLDALKSQGSVTIEALVDAYVSPYLEIASRGDPQWRAYAKLIALIAPDDRHYRIVESYYSPVARLYVKEFSKLNPNVDREKWATAFLLMGSSLIAIVAHYTRIGDFCDTPVPEAPLAYRKELVDFCAGGILRLVTPN